MTLARAILRTFLILQLCLWCHIAVAITGDSNPADLLTKALSEETMEKHLKYLNSCALDGRPACAPQRKHNEEENGSFE